VVSGAEGTLRATRDRFEADFREGRTVTWEDLKTRNGLWNSSCSPSWCGAQWLS